MISCRKTGYGRNSTGTARCSISTEQRNTKGTITNNYKRKLRDSTAGIFLSTAKKIAAPFDRDIWNDAADGQILFSDQESKTLNFQGEGLHEESSSNIGTLDHLKKELMAMN